MSEKLDDIDIRILRELQRNSRLTNLELSEKINLSPSACHRRTQQLESSGYISAYVALLNPQKLERSTTVFVEITLQSQAEELLDAFESQVKHIPNILDCYLMAGHADYLIKLMVKDTKDFAHIHRRFLSRLPGVRHMQSSFALRKVINTTAFSL